MIEKRQYVSFDPKHGSPVGDDLFDECAKCGDLLPSLPPHTIGCRCGNILIDSDAGRLSILDHSAARLFRRSGGTP